MGRVAEICWRRCLTSAAVSTVFMPDCLATTKVTAGTPSSVAEAIKDIPGAEPIKLAPSMRGDKRVAVRFNLVARKASDDAKHEDYLQKFEASDNLKFALSGDAVAENEAPLGKSQAPASGQTGQH